MAEFIRINEADNVVVALTELKKGRILDVDGEKTEIISDIERGHKIAIKDIPAEEDVIKYGYPIGKATCEIKKGEHVHVHNLKTALGDDMVYTYNPVETSKTEAQGLADYFMGYERKNGKVGIRNNLWIIPTVGCVVSVAKEIANLCQDLVGEGVDEIVAFSHPYGCSQLGDDQENTRTILADLINHPNVGGVLVLGLGCENSNIPVLKEYLKETDEERVRFLVCQEVEDEIDEGIKLVEELALRCKKDKRTKQSVEKLAVGLKCGGSDGLSGITANPVVGAFSDILTSKNGTTILTEVPEMFGAETILMNRAKDRETFDKTVKLIKDFKDYFRAHGQTIYENPSPGNKAGGISTLEDKSLGCTQKSGTSTVVDVLSYGEKVKERGLNLLSAPGNDLVAATALASADAQIVLFTTGRGTPFACPVPTVKISTNTPLYLKKKNWIDFDCGSLLENKKKDELAKELYSLVIRIANGERVKSEISGYTDLAIFKQGVTL
ncbi:MAG: altronate dehydratase [Lachnospiraceae bacterium]|nr:altronate dehydratase [Lachnospiraceae bacterium]